MNRAASSVLFAATLLAQGPAKIPDDLRFEVAPMDYFAFRMSQMMDRPVVDLTNLRGGFDFSREYTRELPPAFPENGKINGEDPDSSGPTVFAAVKQQLGLELKAQKGPVEVIVIDRAEKPNDN